VKKLEREKTSSSEEIFRLSWEKASIRKKYDALARDHRELEIQLSERHDKWQFYNQTFSLEEEGMIEGSNLAEQVDFFSGNDFLPWNVNNSSGTRSVSILDSDSDWADSPKVKKLNSTSSLDEILQNYLYITGSAVKLHFPDLDSVKVETLIDQVKNSPFYLYYDLMMVFMQEQMQEKSVDHLLKSRKTLTSRTKHKSLWARFQRLNGGIKSPKKKLRSMLSLGSGSPYLSSGSTYTNEDSTNSDYLCNIKSSVMSLSIEI
jgi:hypothetical protein